MKNLLFIIIAAFLFIPFVLLKNNKKTYYKIGGYTQGTTYHITYSSDDSLDLTSDMEYLLQQFDSTLSTYIPYSLISKINSNKDYPGLNELFLECYHTAVEVYKNTNGAFDITVGPLVNAWGFGKEGKKDLTEDEIDSLLLFVGLEKVKIQDNKVIKENPNIVLDVNAIAQGYSVDYLAGFMEDMKISDYMIEIGGEVRTKGRNPKGVNWKIGIDRPQEDNFPQNRRLQAIVQLSGKSLATSGNYRKFYEEDGRKYVHTINPKTGYTVRSNLLSATVMADECIIADAYATAFMVMGLDKSRELIYNLEGVDAYFIYADDNGDFKEWYTSGFDKLIIK